MNFHPRIRQGGCTHDCAAGWLPPWQAVSATLWGLCGSGNTCEIGNRRSAQGLSRRNYEPSKADPLTHAGTGRHCRTCKARGRTRVWPVDRSSRSSRRIPRATPRPFSSPGTKALLFLFLIERRPASYLAAIHQRWAVFKASPTVQSRSCHPERTTASASMPPWTEYFPPRFNRSRLLERKTLESRPKGASADAIARVDKDVLLNEDSPKGRTSTFFASLWRRTRYIKCVVPGISAIQIYGNFSSEKPISFDSLISDRVPPSCPSLFIEFRKKKGFIRASPFEVRGGGRAKRHGLSARGTCVGKVTRKSGNPRAPTRHCQGRRRPRTLASSSEDQRPAVRRTQRQGGRRTREGVRNKW